MIIAPSELGGALLEPSLARSKMGGKSLEVGKAPLIGFRSVVGLRQQADALIQEGRRQKSDQ